MINYLNTNIYHYLLSNNLSLFFPLRRNYYKYLNSKIIILLLIITIKSFIIINFNIDLYLFI